MKFINWLNILEGKLFSLHILSFICLERPFQKIFTYIPNQQIYRWLNVNKGVIHLALINPIYYMNFNKTNLKIMAFMPTNSLSGRCMVSKVHAFSSFKSLFYDSVQIICFETSNWDYLFLSTFPWLLMGSFWVQLFPFP